MKLESCFLGYLGLEPRTYRLKAEYSTIELVTRSERITEIFCFSSDWYASKIFFFLQYFSNKKSKEFKKQAKVLKEEKIPF
jgi:hypothetical protein